MVESSALIITEEMRLPPFSPKRQVELIQIARMYLRERDIPISQNSLKSAMGVLGDAFLRQRKIQPADIYSGKHPIRPLIKEGVGLREEFKQRAVNLLRITQQNPTNCKDPQGPFAIPGDVIKKAEEEASRFDLTGNLGGLEELVKVSEQRTVLVRGLAAKVLSSLPVELSAASVDSFPNPSDQAKIIRNSIVKFIFAHNLSPLFNIDQLKLYSSIAKTQPMIFEEHIKSSLARNMNVTEQSELSYLYDLFEQVKTSFFRQPEMTYPDKITELEFFHSYYNHDLLLLHPALEQQRIATRTREIEEGKPSLWDRGVNMGGVIVPTVEVLLDAFRQERAVESEGRRGLEVEVTKDSRSNAPQRRLLRGVSLWRQRALQGRQAQFSINSLKVEIKSIQDNIDGINSGEIGLPSSVYRFWEVTGSSVHKKIADGSRLIGQKTQHILAISSQIDHAYQYHDWLLDQFPGNLPDKVPLPSAHLSDQLRSAAIRIPALERRLNVIGNLIEVERLTTLPKQEWASALVKIDTDSVDKEVTRLERLDPSSPTSSDLYDAYQSIDNNLQFITRVRGVPETEGYRTFLMRLHRQLPLVTEASGLTRKEKEEFKRKLVKEAIRNKLGVLRVARVHIQNRDATLEKKSTLEKQIPQGPVWPNQFWSSKEALDYIREYQASDVGLMDQQELVGLMPKDRTTYWLTHLFPSSLLPSITLSKHQLYELITRELEVSQGKFDMRTKAYEVASTQGYHARTVERLAELKKGLEEYCPPLPIGEGLSVGAFLRAWSRRLRVAWAIADIHKLDIARASLQGEYDMVARRVYLKRLQGQIRLRESKINAISNHNLDLEMVNKMRELDLVLEIESNFE